MFLKTTLMKSCWDSDFFVQLGFLFAISFNFALFHYSILFNCLKQYVLAIGSLFCVKAFSELLCTDVRSELQFLF